MTKRWNFTGEEWDDLAQVRNLLHRVISAHAWNHDARMKAIGANDQTRLRRLERERDLMPTVERVQARVAKLEAKTEFLWTKRTLPGGIDQYKTQMGSYRVHDSENFTIHKGPDTENFVAAWNNQPIGFGYLTLAGAMEACALSLGIGHVRHTWIGG